MLSISREIESKERERDQKGIEQRIQVFAWTVRKVCGLLYDQVGHRRIKWNGMGQGWWLFFGDELMINSTSKHNDDGESKTCIF